MNSHPVSPDNNVCSGLAIKSFYLAFIVAAIFLATPSYGQSPEIRKAFRFIDIEQPSKALAALEQLPVNSTNLYYLGLAQLRTGNKDKALATFEKGISASDKDGLNYAGKGYVRMLEKNPTDAKVQLDKALAVSKSKDVGVLKAVAEAYLTDTKFLLDAITLLNKAKTINGTDPEVHLLLGDALLVQNKQNAGETVTSYERAAKADPKLAKPHFKIGKIYERARSNDIAIASFEKAIAVDAEYAPAYKELGQTYYVQKEADKAVKMYEKYLSITETPGDAKYQLAFFYFMAKNYEKANEIFKEVTTNSNVSCFALRYYAYSLTEQKKTDEARKIFERYFQCAKPEEIQASDYAYYGKLLVEFKSDSLANENFAKSLKLDSAQTEILALHAEAYSRRKKFPEAIATYKQLMKTRKAPLSQDLFAIGRAYYMNEQFPQADTAFTQLSEKQPNMTVGYLWAGRARQHIDSTGVQGLSKPMYEIVIEKGSQNPEKYKKDLIEAYDYLGTYSLQIKNNVEDAKNYFDKILQLDPNNERAKEFMKQLKSPPPSKGK